MISNRHSAIESNSAFTAKVEDLVKEIVIQNNILYYRIESSIEHHANVGGEDNFMPVIRIITYFEDTVSQISDLLNTEFEIIAESAVDKNKSRVESFSYKHIQYLVRLQANRRELTEYKRSGDKQFEIQICSMLQDAWAGIEKELGYDSESFPEAGKRDLYRVGALLEMADLEFLKIRSKFINQSPATKQKENYFAPSVAPQPEVYDEPLAAAQEVVVNDIAEEPVAVPHKEIPVAVPVIQQPEVITAPVVIPEPAPVVVSAAAPPVMQPIAPQQAIPVPAPVPAPVGIAPKPTRIEIAETMAAAVVPVVESFVPAPVVNDIAKNIADTKAPEQQVHTFPEMPAPIAAVAAQIENIVSIPVSAPIPVSQAAQTFNVEQFKVDNVEKMKVSVSGNIVKEEVKNEEGSAPFFEDLIVEENTRAVKPAPLDENAPITDSSLKEYVLKSKLLKEIDKQIAERAGARINGDIDIEGDVERLRFLKVYTLKQLHDRLKDNNTDIVAFAEKWIGKDNGGSFDSGISLFYLEYLLVGKKNDPAFAVEYVVKFISDNDYSARYIIPTYNSIRSTEAPNFSHLTLK